MNMMQLGRKQLEQMAAQGDSAASAELSRREVQRASGGRGVMKVGKTKAPHVGVGFAIPAGGGGYTKAQLRQLAEVGYDDAAAMLARKEKKSAKAASASKARKAGKAKMPRTPKVQSPGRAAQAVKMKLIWQKATEIAQRKYGQELKHVLSECLKEAHAWYKASRAAQAEVKMAANPNLFYYNRIV